MFSNAFHGASGDLDLHRRAAAALSAALIAVLAVLPTVSALADAGPLGSGGAATRRPATVVRPAAAPGELLPAGKLEELLARLPLDSLSATQLAHYLAGLEGVGALAGLPGLLGKDLGTAGVDQALTEAIAQLKLGNPSATLGELANVESLPPALEDRLTGLLELLGSPLTAEQTAALEHALGSLSLDQLVGSLLSSAQPTEQLAGELSDLTGGLFGELAGGELQGLLGSSLAGGFAAKTEGAVAEELHSTPTAVSEALGQTAPPLPATVTMLTAPLASGGLVGVAPAVKGLAVGLLSGAGAGEGGQGSGEGGTGSGEGGGSGGHGSGEGGSGGAGGKGSSEGNGNGSGQGGNGAAGSGQGGAGEGGQGGSTSTTTILLTVPSASSSTHAASATSKRALGKVRILSHTVRGRVATLVLRVPSAGRVVLAGRDVRAAGAHAAKAGRLELTVSLSKAAAASLHRGRSHRLEVKLRASFRPAAGSSSSAAVTVTFA